MLLYQRRTGLGKEKEIKSPPPGGNDAAALPFRLEG